MEEPVEPFVSEINAQWKEIKKCLRSLIEFNPTA